MRRSFPFLLLCLLILSCRSHWDQRLDAIESLLDTDPKQGLAQLDSIPIAMLHSDRDKAKYALVKSIALDKNYIDVDYDSLTRIALNYYEPYGNTLEKEKAYYYHGVVKRNAGDYIESILFLERAEQAGLRIKDYYRLGLIYRMKGDIFNATNNFPASIECLKKAVSSFRTANKDLHTLYTLLALSNVFINARQYTEAKAILNQIKGEEVSESFSRHILVNEAVIASEEGRWDEALQCFSAIPSQYLHCLDLGCYAVTLSHTGHPNEANYVLDVAYQMARDSLERANVDYIASQIKMNYGEADDALVLLNNAMRVQNAHTHHLLEQSISLAQRDFYKDEQIREENERLEERRRWIGGIAAGLLVMLGVLFHLIKVSIDRNRTLKDQMARMSEGQLRMQKLQQDNAEILGSLFSQRILKLNQLSSAYFETNDSGKKEILFNDFKNEISRFGKEKEAFLSLEEDLNRYCDGIMSKLSNQIPQIKGENRTIISLFFAGIDYDTIRILMKRNSVQSLKTLKSRLKAIITKSDAEDKALFLEMLRVRKVSDVS